MRRFQMRHLQLSCLLKRFGEKSHALALPGVFLCALALSACQASTNPFAQLEAVAAANSTSTEKLDDAATLALFSPEQGAAEVEAETGIDAAPSTGAETASAEVEPAASDTASLALTEETSTPKPVEAVTAIAVPTADREDGGSEASVPVKQAALPARLHHAAFKPMVREPNFFERATLRRLHYEPLIRRIAKQQGVPPRLAMAIVEIESNFRRDATGLVGEVGLMQIKPRTARGLGYSGTTQELYEPETNITYGMKYLAEAHRRGGGTTCGTILKYNAGHYAKRMNPTSAKYCQKVRKVMARR